MASNTSVPTFFVSNDQGGLIPNSAGSAMVMALAEDISNTPSQTHVPDHKMMPDRQARVDRFFTSSNGISEHQTKDQILSLPRLASPQRLHNHFQSGDLSRVEALRSVQKKTFEGSFLGQFYPIIHDVIDKGINESKAIETQIVAENKKNKSFLSVAMSSLSHQWRFGEEEKQKIFRPVELAVHATNSWMSKMNFPMRVAWREIIGTDNNWSLDMWMVYANVPAQARNGLQTWFGSTDIVDPRDRTNKEVSRLNMYFP